MGTLPHFFLDARMTETTENDQRAPPSLSSTTPNKSTRGHGSSVQWPNWTQPTKALEASQAEHPPHNYPIECAQHCMHSPALVTTWHSQHALA